MVDYEYNSKGYAISYIYSEGDIVTIWEDDNDDFGHDYRIKNFSNEKVTIVDMFGKTKTMSYKELRSAIRKCFSEADNRGFKPPPPKPEELKFVFEGENKLSLF